MFLLRTARQQQPKLLASATRSNTPALTFISKRFNSSDYGSGEHNNLKREKSDHEHPGPPPPDTSNYMKGSSSQTQSSGSKKAEDGDKPQPKIFSPPQPKEESEDVKKHNEDMKQRSDRPIEGRKD